MLKIMFFFVILKLFSSITGDTSATTPPPTSFPATCHHSNDSANENQGGCFAQMRQIPLDSFRKLCTPSETEQQDGDGAVSSSSRRKYVQYSSEAGHLSSKFIVEMMASHIETKPEFLEEIIVKLEKLLIQWD